MLPPSRRHDSVIIGLWLRIASSSASKIRRPAAPGATGSTSAARRGRWRSRSGTICLSSWRASSPAATSRPTRSTLFSIRPSSERCPIRMCSPPCRRRQRASPMLSCAARASRFSATTTSTARHPPPCWRGSCGHGGVEPIIHIPDRLFEGYGPNVEAVRALAARGATLLVTVDCGTTSVEPLSEAKALGMDVVVIDHHQADEALPPALAIVNPNRRDDLSGLGYLAAVGLVFMTVVAVNRELRARGFWTEARPEPDLLTFLDDVALGTVADVVPLIGLNRAFVAKGLLVLRRREQPGLVSLMDVARLSGPPEAWHLGFLLGPAHQCRRPHRPRRSRRAAAAGNRSDRSGQDRRRTRPAQSRAAGDRAGDLGAGRSRGHGRARHRGERRRGDHRRRRLASRRRRPRRRAAEGKVRPAGICHCARARRHRHRLGPLHRRRRYRPRRAPRRRRRLAGQRRRPRHGGRRDVTQGRAGATARVSRSGAECRRRLPRAA